MIPLSTESEVAEVAEVEAPKKTKSSAKTNLRASKMADGTVKAKAVKPKDRYVREAAALLRNAGDVTRVAVLLNLSVNGAHNVGEICKALDNPSQPAVSHHLALLRHGGFVDTQRDGKSNYYDLTTKGKKLVKAINSVVSTEE